MNFLMKTSPKSFSKNEAGEIVCVFEGEDGEKTEVFDTVLIATGRWADIEGLNLEAVGVKSEKGKLPVNEKYETSVPNIMAIGDIIVGAPELTPVAIREGLLVADRLYKGVEKKLNYDNIATTIFTPLEYGAVGLSEVKAIEKFGEENVEVYHTSFKPLEWNFLPSHDGNLCYTKVIVNSLENEKVVGVHFVGPHAGEVIQGFAVAVVAGLTKADFDETVGIHPTCAEEMT